MTSPTVPPNAYTDAPTLHPNLILGSLQLLFWLFFHPSAWRNHVARVDPDLSPNFSLAELSRTQWSNPALRRLLSRMYLVWPLLVGLLVSLVLGIFSESGKNVMIGLAQWIGGESWTNDVTVSVEAILAHGVVYGIAVIVAVNLMGSEVLGVARGVAIGVVGGIIGGVVNGIKFGVVGGEVVRVAVGPMATMLGNKMSILATGVADSIMIGIILGVAGGVASTLDMESQELIHSRVERTIGTLIGVLFGGIVLVVGVGVASGAGEVVSDVAYSVAFGIVLGAAYGVVVGWHTHRWRRSMRIGMGVGVGVGVMYGVVLSVARGVVVDVPGGLALGVAFGIGNGTVLSVLFLLPYLYAKRIAGPRAGAVAGALGGAVFMVLPSIDGSSGIGINVLWPIIPITLSCVLLGLTWNLWLPVALYPFLVAWNLLLYYIDEQRSGDRSSLLRYHSAFWDEHQRLRLFGLDEHLVLLMERNPSEGQAAIEYLSTGRQRWSAQAAQIELDARGLERCVDAMSVGNAHRSLAAGELIGPASALLRSFSRISQDVEAASNKTTSYRKRLALSAVEDRLDGLLRELTRSSERYAARFRPIATRWREIVAEHARELAQAAEVRQEIDNPYIFGVPLTEQQEVFVGRTDIGAHIEQLLLDRRHPPLLLYGQRRMGKTSLLHNLGRLLPSTIVPLFVDGGGISAASDYSALLYNIAREMAKSAERQRGLLLPSLGRETLVADPFTHFNEWLDKVEQALSSQGLSMALLTLDEFEALDSVMSKGRFDERDFLRTLRHLIQHRPYFKLLLAGSYTIEDFEHWASYLINVSVIKISYLEKDETRQLIEQPVQNFSLRYEPDASQRVLDLTRGHPHLVQLLCYEIVTLKNEQEPTVRRLACLSDVEMAVPRALNSGSFFFVDIQQNQVDDKGRAMLRFLARLGEGAVISRDALAHQFPDEFEHTLPLLLRRDLIEATEGDYRFQVELIRRWFARSDNAPHLFRILGADLNR